MLFSSNNKYFRLLSIGKILGIDEISGKFRVERIADIEGSKIKRFDVDRNNPKKFKNRDVIYCNESPKEPTTIGVWEWEVVPNNNDPEKDYIAETKIRNDIKITEIIEIPTCNSRSDILYKLINGFEKNYICNSFLIVYSTPSLLKHGLLCNHEDFNFDDSGTIVKLKSDVNHLNCYTVNLTNTILLSGIRVYNSIDIGQPKSEIRVRPPHEILKNCLLNGSLTSKSDLRKKGFTRNDATNFMNILEHLPNQNFINNFMNVCKCSEEEARKWIKEFIKHADTFLSAKDVDMEILSSALMTNFDLEEKYKQDIALKWRKENEETIASKETEIKEIQQSIEKLELQKNKLKSEIKKLNLEIENKKKQSKDINDGIESRIIEAKQNIADFISETTFLSATVTPLSNANNFTSLKSIEVSKSCINNEFKNDIDSIDDFEDELTENLKQIGYNPNIANDMSQAISFCLCDKIPIIVGENAVAVAKCLATTLGDQELSEIFISDQDFKISDIISTSDEIPSVFLVHGVLDNYSVKPFNALANLLRNGSLKTSIVISLEGIPAYMIPPRVWNHAFYIDGDVGLENDSPNCKLFSYKTTVDFALTEQIDDKFLWKTKRMLKQHYSKVLSNVLICRYARYLAFRDYVNNQYKEETGEKAEEKMNKDVNLNTHKTILSQMVVLAKSLGGKAEEELAVLFRKNGIHNGNIILEYFR